MNFNSCRHVTLYLYHIVYYFLLLIEPLTKWSDGPLIAPTSATRPTGGLSSRPPAVVPSGGNVSTNNISIFVDPDVSVTNENELTKSNQKLPKKQGMSYIAHIYL